MSGRNSQSAPFIVRNLEVPEVLDDGLRLDGRGLEEFREVCKSLMIFFYQFMCMCSIYVLWLERCNIILVVVAIFS